MPMGGGVASCRAQRDFVVVASALTIYTVKAGVSQTWFSSWIRWWPRSWRRGEVTRGKLRNNNVAAAEAHPLREGVEPPPPT